jgi:hypothetical protein
VSNRNFCPYPGFPQKTEILHTFTPVTHQMLSTFTFTNMKKYFFILPLLALLACGSRDEKNPNDPSDGGNNTDSLNLNKLVTNTLFDSLPVEAIPYTDSICVETYLPKRKIQLTTDQINFLQIRELRVFSQYNQKLDDSLFSAVCRLKLSPEYFSIIISYDGENEMRNFLINYDRHFRVIDYLESAYDELVESALRTTSTIDTSAVLVHFSNIMAKPEFIVDYQYHMSPDGFFRERIAEK